MIKLFKVDEMFFTPFNNPDDLEFFKQKGILITDNLEKCDIFIGCNSRHFNRLRIRFGLKKKYFLWTNEPRVDINFQNKTRQILWIPGIHIMNVYTGDVYLNNYTFPFAETFFKNYWKTDKLAYLNNANFGEINPKVAALISYRNEQEKWSFKKQGIELDLSYLRTQIALNGYSLKMVDIYGKGWSKEIYIGESRGSNWQNRKGDILKNYHFNLCFENTNFNYYCTEKIWDSIRYLCLPIYYGTGNKIYEDFPKDSFLDYCNFSDSEALFEYIANMKIQEYRERMNMCIEVFNKTIEKVKADNPYEKMLSIIVNKIKEIVEV